MGTALSLKNIRNQEKTFLTQKQLELNDEITIECEIPKENKKILTIGLVTGNSQPDPKNIACQVDVKEDRTVEVKSVNKGTIKQHPIDPTKIDGTIISTKFIVRQSKNVVDIHLDESHLASVPVPDVSSIRFISVKEQETN
uniref:SFRICE_003876 n=1 Tax=Spodoptera frugiperda TaxID=7108 RepID=A0A2H1VU77_SPOFR